MLTYYHYLLGGLFAATCVAGNLIGSFNLTPPTSTLAAPSVDSIDSNETIDVSYRGSGRVDDAPKEQQGRRDKLVAHRGSGRIDPASM